MIKYEGFFLLDNGKVKNEAQKGIDAISDLLKKHSANIVKIGKWDERKLAYEIRKQKRGIYVLAHFEATGPAISDMTRELNLSEVVSRHIFLRLDNQKAFPPFMTASEFDAAYGSKEFRDRGPRRPSDDGGPRGRRRDVEAETIGGDEGEESDN